MRRSIRLIGLLFGSAIVLGMLALVAGRYHDMVQPTPGVQEVTLRSGEFAFEPERLKVRADAPVRLVLDNTAGELLHDVTVDAVRSRGPLAELLGPRVHVEAPPGSRPTVEFVPATGTYLFYCSVYRHSLDGMVGVLVVD